MLPGAEETETITEGIEPEPRSRSRWWSPIRIPLLALAALLGVYTVASQALAMLPVSWTVPVLRMGFAQLVVLGAGWVRDWLGSWNAVLALAAVIAALLAVRIRRSWPSGSVVAVTVLGLVMCVVTSVGLAVAAHDATGAWLPFAPLRLVAAGRSPDQTVTYATLDGQPLRADLYLPPASPEPAPLVVNIHGGGFTGGGRGPTPYNHWLAGHGYAVLDVDYRLADADHPRWNTEDADIGCALIWAVSHAGKYHWDPDRIATFGGSAGGNLAINAAYKANAGRLRPSCGAAERVPKVRAVVAVYPVVNMTASAGDSIDGERIARTYLGGPVADYPDRYAATDSARQITPAAPPTLLFHGGGDHLVFASHTAEFANTLTAAGVTNRYVELPYLDHGFDTEVLNTGARVGRDITLDWLDHHDKP